MNGIESIAAERQRQIEAEGWTPEHDDEHDRGELAGAAATYALYRSHVDPVHLMGADVLAMAWPFEAAWWKPRDHRSDLVRAGALIAAEIDRLDRAATKS